MLPVTFRGKKAHSEPCQTSKMKYSQKIVYGFYFRKILHLRWKSSAIFGRRSIFDDGWYSPDTPLEYENIQGEKSTNFLELPDQ